MVAKAQQEEAQSTDMVDLLRRIEEFLSSPPPQPHLTQEDRTALSAPLDPKFLRQRKGQGGKMFTYADLDYLESRVVEVDPDWSIHFDANTQNVLICRLTIHSVSRSAVSGYYVPDEYEVWDNNKKQMVSKLMTAEVSHTIVTRAQAAAERRAMAMFGLGAELWAHNQEGADDFIPSTEDAPRGRTRTSNQEFRAPTAGRINLLVDFGVPESIAKLINSAGRGTGSDGYPISDVSETIKALMEARGKNKGPVARKVWEEVVSRYAPYAFKDIDDEDTEDWAS